ncbi:MAG: nuclease-related domain-containing protein, partial [Acidobacteriota bacterium]
MARIHVMGPYRGPGEQKTVETLGLELPDSWEIIACCSLPGTHDDLDIIVLAPNLIFVLEEKAWGPRVVTGAHSWDTTNAQYASPTDRVAHLARVLAGRLRNRDQGYRREVGGRHAVASGVVLSHDNLQLQHGVDFDHRDLVLQLRNGQASDELIRLSSSERAQPFSDQLKLNLLEFLA